MDVCWWRPDIVNDSRTGPPCGAMRLCVNMVVKMTRENAHPATRLCGRMWFFGALLLVTSFPTVAATLYFPSNGTSLAGIVQQAASGDVIVIAKGVYSAHLVIDKPLTLRGKPGAVLDGGGRGDVIRVRAPHVVIQGLTIRHSGTNLNHMDAGIFAERTASHILIKDNFLDQNGFGIWLDSCADSQVIDNRIRGNTNQRRLADRGNGIQLANITRGLVAGNEIWQTRDGLYVETSTDCVLRDNRMHDLRYGVHYMYSNHDRLINNHTWNTRSGYALMSSDHLIVSGNHSKNDQVYGLLLNYITYSTIEDNTIRGIHGDHSIIGGVGKAIFIYNSEFNIIRNNVLADSDIGIHLTAGSENNVIYGNAFIDNRTQVKYVANHTDEWSLHGRGNYWSDYLGWDRNDDGIGDVAYEPNDAVDKLLWTYPLARVLMSSPAVETLRWVQTQFPVLKPQGVQDSYPLMQPPVIPGTRQ